MAASPVLRLAALVAATLLLTACEDLLPGRPPARPAALAEDSAVAPPPRTRRAAASRPEPDGLEAESAFGQIRQSLRRLVAAQQGFYAENGTYSGDFERLGFRPAGTSEVKLLWVTRDGWAARGTHPALTGRDCVTYVGAGRGAPATRRFGRTGREGVIVCDSRAAAEPARSGTAAPAAPVEAAPSAADTASALDVVDPNVQMRVDLRKLGVAQAAYFGTQGLYSRQQERLPLQFGWQRGVEVRILSADRRSWTAQATHAARPGRSCVVWHGSPVARPATKAQRKVPQRPGVAVCDD